MRYRRDGPRLGRHFPAECAPAPTPVAWAATLQGMDGAALRSKVRGAARAAQAAHAGFVGSVVAALDARPGATVAELAAELGAHRRRVERAVARLLGEGRLLRRGPKLFPAVSSGISEGSSGEVGWPSAMDSPLAVVLASLPSDAHRGFLRLYLGAAVARYHLAQQLTDGWPAAIVFGETGAFKTALGAIAARLFGQSEAAAVRVIGRETARSLLGRRTIARGAVGFDPSRYLRGPVLVLDEADKASGNLRRDLLLLLQGDAGLELEGVRFAMRAAPLVTFNAEELPPWLHPAYLRRSFVLDTNGIATRRAVSEAARALFARELPRLDLAALRPPVRAVGAEGERRLEELVAPWLTRHGASLFDARYIAKCALGLVPLLRVGLWQALVQVALDYLACAATLGQAQAGFAEALAPLLAREAAEAPPLPGAPQGDPEDAEDEARESDALGLPMLLQACAEGLGREFDAAFRDGYAACTAPRRGRPPKPGDMDLPGSREVLRLVLGELALPRDLAAARAYGDSELHRCYRAGQTEGRRLGYALGWQAAERELRASEELDRWERPDAALWQVQRAMSPEARRDRMAALEDALGDGTPETAARGLASTLRLRLAPQALRRSLPTARVT